MPILATDTPRFSNVVKHEYEPSIGFCREVVVANEAAAKTYAIGAVLGQVTATGKYKISEASATDGSEVAAAIVLEDKAVAATTDVKVLVAVRGPMLVSKGGLVLGTSIDTDGEKAAVYAALAAKNILVNDTI